MLKTFIVEDNALELANVQKFLAQKCPQAEIVGTAGGVAEAIEGISMGRPDLLITDIQIIGGRCYDLLDRLDEAGQLAGLRIIFMTLFQDFDQFRDRFAHAPVAFLEKPFTASDIKRAVEKVVRIPLTSQSHEQVLRLLKLLSGESALPTVPPENPPIASRSGESWWEKLRRLFG
ncbi:LytR/AlgR family response regulator transcription factor [Persicitalea sp.]|uniref:LytR/AlgR family response regulator transcription factor n=1 Tax=Persicitalea sp. TaxID=3100273 RepID=UPI003593045F